MGKETDLLHAVKNGDVSFVRKALQKFRSSHKHRKASRKSNINVPDADGFTILHHAALGGNVEVVMALIEMEADPNARDKKGMCPLHMAAWAGKDQAVKCLLESNALVNLPSFNGETAIHLGSQHGYASVVDFLLKFKADPTIRSNTMETPLDLACQYGHIAVVRLLLKSEKVVGTLRGRHDDPRYKSPLHLAAKSGHADIVRLLIETGADVNEETVQGTCLHHASLYGKTEVVRLLLEAGADVNALNKNNMTPLDIVNKFTTSRAGIEIKQMLREAAGERIVYARAQSNYHNIYDNTCLSFKAGETITVLEQNEDGRWKGSIISNNEEKIGYFPAQLVSLISERASTASRASAGSLDSAISQSSANASLADKENLIPKENARKTVSASAKAVGVVPIGSYELLTLSTGGSTSQKQRPINVPRMSSFKRTAAPVVQQRTRQREDISELEHRRNTDFSQLERSELREQRAMTYDIVPGKRSVEGTSVRQNAPSVSSMACQDSENGQERGEGYAVTSSDPSLRNYAEVVVAGGHSNISQLTAATEYTEVCIGNDNKRSSSLVQSSNSDVSSSSRHSYDGSQLDELNREPLENGKLEHVAPKLGSRTPDEKRKLKSDQRAGYEDMNMKIGGNGAKEESAPALPRKMGKLAHDKALKDVQDLSTLKRIESRGIRGRQDTYENFSPRIIPVATHNPFSGAFSGSIANNIRDSYGSDNVLKSKDFMPPYENYCPGLVAPPVPAKPGRHSYENVAGQPYEEESAGETEPIPLPPKSQFRQKCQIDVPKSPLASPGLSDSLAGVYPHVDYGSLTEDDKMVFDWLTEHKLACYFDNFQRDGFDMISICGLTPEDLNALGINKAGHRKKILSEVTKLDLQTGLPSHKPDDVGKWLSLMGMQQYEENFIEGGFDDIDFIKDLDRNDLEMIEIKKRGHQRKLLMGVKKLAQLELTSSLDKLVDASADTCFQGTDESSFEFPPPPSLPSPIPPPPPPPVDEFDLQPMSQREHLPPPPGAESKSQNQKSNTFSLLKEEPVGITTSSRTTLTSSVPAVTRTPLPSSPKSPADSVEYPVSSGEREEPSNPPQPLPKPTHGFKSATSRTNHNVVVPVKPPRSPGLPTRSGTLPPPKTKPKPVVKKGQVQTAAEYHGNTKASSSRGMVFVGPSISDQPLEEDVTPAKLREFWGLSTQEPEKRNAEQHIRAHRTCSVSSVKPAPVTKPVIMPKPKRRNTDSELKQTRGLANSVIASRECEVEPLAEEMVKDASIVVRSKVKRAAPPAAPDEDGIKSNSNPNNDDVFHDPAESGRSRMMSVPSSTTTVEKSNKETSDAESEDLKETDVLMADIDNLIADFSTQLESMF